MQTDPFYVYFVTIFLLYLTLILLTWRIRWAPNNVSRWQAGFNSAFKGFKLFGQCDNKWCKMFTWNWIQDCHGRSSIQQEDSSHQQIWTYVTKKLVQWHTWSRALYGPETGALRKLDQKYLRSSEMWCWRRKEKIIWTDRVRNEVLRRVKEERNILQTIQEG